MLATGKPPPIGNLTADQQQQCQSEKPPIRDRWNAGSTISLAAFTVLTGLVTGLVAAHRITAVGWTVALVLRGRITAAVAARAAVGKAAVAVLAWLAGAVTAHRRAAVGRTAAAVLAARRIARSIATGRRADAAAVSTTRVRGAGVAIVAVSGGRAQRGIDAAAVGTT